MKNRSVIFAIIIGLAVVGLAFFYTLEKTREKNSIAPTSELKKVANFINEQDSDNDGLLDWEEALWGTDPKNPDSDGDGTLDGEEIATNRNPIIAGPDDTLSQEVIETVINRNSNEPQTETDKFSRDLFARYLSFKQGTAPLDEASKQIVINSVLAENQNEEKITLHSAGELNLTTDISTTSLRTYGNSLGVAIIGSTPKNLKNELAVVEKALTTGEETDLADLDPIIKGYTDLIEASLEIKVPKSAIDLHLGYLNSLEEILALQKGMKLALTDPIRALTAINSYPTAVDKLSGSLDLFGILFASNKVSFSPTEPGSALVGSF